MAVRDTVQLGGVSRDSTGFGAMEEGLISRSQRAGEGSGAGGQAGPRSTRPGRLLFLRSTLGHSFMFMLSEHLLRAKPPEAQPARSGSDSKPR